jgi:hypothetical protein
MKKLLFTALIALLIISCTTKDSEIIKANNQLEKAEGLFSFTYNGISETIYNEAVFDGNGYDVAIVLKNKKVTISSVDRKYISGTFSSDKITGKFENIRYNTIF